MATEVTLAANSAAAASACPWTLSEVIPLSVVDSWSASERTCVRLVASRSRKSIWTELASCLAMANSWFSDESRSARTWTSGSVLEPVRSCLSWVGAIDGSERPAKLTSSLELPRAPRAMGAA